MSSTCSTPLKLKWTHIAQMEASKKYFGSWCGSNTLVGGRIYWTSILGKLHIYSLKYNRWLEGNETLPGVDETDVGVLCDDRIFFCGGMNRRSLIEYDTVLGESRQLQTVHAPPLDYEGMSAVFADWRREIVYFGGVSKGLEGDHSNETYAFNVDNQGWTHLKMRGAHPEPRVDHQAVLLGTKMYVFGGFDQDDYYFDELWIADLFLSKHVFWSSPRVTGAIPSLQSPVSVNVYDGRLVVFGAKRYNNVEVIYFLHPKESKWEDSLNSNIVVTGIPPTNTRYQKGVSTGSGIIYFTVSNVHSLSKDVIDEDE